MVEYAIPLVEHGPFGNGHSNHASRAFRPGQQAYRVAPVSRPDARVRHEAALADLTAMVLQSTDVADAERAAVAVLQALFDADLVMVLRLLPDKKALALESGTDGAGWLPPAW